MSLIRSNHSPRRRDITVSAKKIDNWIGKVSLVEVGVIGANSRSENKDSEENQRN